MRVAVAFAAIVAVASTSTAQRTATPARPPFWADTVGESPVYPVGEAIPVYRAVLDLLYIDGDRRPSVIIMWDTAERRSSPGPCPIAKCPGMQWTHKSKMDTATVLALARLSPKRPRIRDFGYPIPLVLISPNDVHRMTADGNEILAEHPRPDYQGPIAGFWAELARKYPGAWGVTILSKVGFNRSRSEALVWVHQWCGDSCRSIENIFLKKTAGRWRVVERIPSVVSIDLPSRLLRYVGPAGTTPQESEVLVPQSRTGAPSEATARAAVYRAVLDSLYSFQGDHPQTVVLTDFFLAPFDSVPKRPGIVSALARKFALLRRVRAPLDNAPSYRIPIVTLPMDSLLSLRERGVSLDKVAQTGFPQELAFTKRYPGAWGMLSMSRVAFNTNRSTALVYTSHICGEHCRNGDTWLLQRTGSRWKIVDRIPAFSEQELQVEPLRYLGLDANPNAYRPRRVQGVVTDYTTGKPIPFLDIKVRRSLNSGVLVSAPTIHTDSAGHYTLTNLPLNSMVSLVVPCPDTARGAQVQPIGVMPGMDTTINFPVDFSVCEPVVEAPPPPSALSGAQAFIGKDSARFVFPLQGTGTYYWDIPAQGAYPDYPQYMWGVQWSIPDIRAGNTPYMLWLTKRWQAGGPRSGSLEQLIAGVRLEPMIEGTTCDGCVFADPGTDHSKVFATIENGQLIFVVRGARAVRRIFPSTPVTVTFSQNVQLPAPEGPGRFNASQEVLVNCRNSDESPEAKRHCDVQH